MHRLLKKALTGAVTTALGVGLVPLLGASPAYAADGRQSPDPNLNPTVVNSQSGTFQLVLPSGAACDGDSASDSWRWHTFISEATRNVATIAFNSSGPTPTDYDGSDGTMLTPLFSSTGDAMVSRQTVADTGVIPPGTSYTFDPAQALGHQFQDGGEYLLGVVCTDNTSALRQWWIQTVTIRTTSAPPFMAQGTVPNAPVLNSLVPNSGQLTANFTPNGGTSFTAQASSDDFATIAGTATGAASPLTITTLTNGTLYKVRVRASTPAGNSPWSNVLTGTPQTNGGPVLNLTLTNGQDAGGDPTVQVDWDPPAPVSGCTVQNYAVSSTSGTVSSPTTATDAVVTGVTPGAQVQVTVTPSFGSACFGQPTSASTIVPADVVLYQDIDVTRPIGALVLTQVCGSRGAIPLETTSPGFPNGLPPLESQYGSLVGAPNPGVEPGSTPTLAEDGDPTTNGDPNKPEYPYPTDGNGVPNADATHCGVDLGVAQFVTRGVGAGQYFAASGTLSQVTIVDTRNVDAGWFVTGTITDFASDSLVDDGSGFSVPATDSFGGDQLGWTPVHTDDTDAFTYDTAGGGTATYDQVASAGPAVRPNTGQDAADNTNIDPDTGAVVDGLTNGETLGYAAPGAGLGTAIFDARLKVLIPITADAGVYEATLNVTAV